MWHAMWPLLKAASIIAGRPLVISCLLLRLSIPEVHCGIDAERKARIVSWHVTSRLATCPPPKKLCFPQSTNNTCNYLGRCRANTDGRLAQPCRVSEVVPFILLWYTCLQFTPLTSVRSFSSTNEYSNQKKNGSNSRGSQHWLWSFGILTLMIHSNE